MVLLCEPIIEIWYLQHITYTVGCKKEISSVYSLFKSLLTTTAVKTNELYMKQLSTRRQYCSKGQSISTFVDACSDAMFHILSLDAAGHMEGIAGLIHFALEHVFE